jgi:tRNA (guanine-N7-)-methyltransferase
MLKVLEASRNLENAFTGFAPTQPWRPQTTFERKGLAKGHSIFELYYRKAPPMRTPGGGDPAA